MTAAQCLFHFTRQLDGEQRVPLWRHPGVDHQRVEFRTVVGEWPVPEPVDQFVPVGGFEHIRQFPDFGARPVAERERDQVDVVIAQHHRGPAAK